MNVKHKVRGFFKLYTHIPGPDGSLELSRELGEFENLITDSGLELMKGAGFLNCCRVGTGSTPPSVSDTGLVNQVAAKTIQPSMTAGPYERGPSEWYSTVVSAYTFGQGEAAGNLSELGIAGTASGPLFSRALIKDSEGNPITLTVLPIEFLTVVYSLRVYVDTSPVPDESVVLNGSPYTVSTLWAGSAAFDQGAWIWNYYGPGGDGRSASGFSGAHGGFGVKPQGAIPYPSGNSTQTPGPSGSPYVDQHFAFSISQGNGTLTAVAANVDSRGLHTYKFLYSPPFVKDNTMTLQFTLRLSWGRAT